MNRRMSMAALHARLEKLEAQVSELKKKNRAIELKRRSAANKVLILSRQLARESELRTQEKLEAKRALDRYRVQVQADEEKWWDRNSDRIARFIASLQTKRA